MQLRGNDGADPRQERNKEAIGGMKDPRLSNRRIPLQKEVGLRVARSIDAYLDECPRAQEAILSSIGQTKDKVKPPTQEQIKACRRGVERTLRCDGHSTSDLTELQSHIYEAWVDQAQDPDHEVPAWLKYGGPAGIDMDAGAVDIFPILTEEEAARYPHYDLNFPHEGHANYVSMEESPHGQKVMADLVSSKYVLKFKSRRLVRQFLKRQRTSPVEAGPNNDREERAAEAPANPRLPDVWVQLVGPATGAYTVTLSVEWYSGCPTVPQHCREE